VLTERRDAERSRLYDGTVTNQREMQSLEAEIAAVERRVTEHEDELMEVLEQVEELETRLAGWTPTAPPSSSASSRSPSTATTPPRACSPSSASSRPSGSARRTGCPPDLLERYEALAARTAAPGWASSRATACTACRLDLSMADVNDLLTGPPPLAMICPQCQRLLVAGAGLTTRSGAGRAAAHAAWPRSSSSRRASCRIRAPWSDYLRAGDGPTGSLARRLGMLGPVLRPLGGAEHRHLVLTVLGEHGDPVGGVDAKCSPSGRRTRSEARRATAVSTISRARLVMARAAARRSRRCRAA
jgi:hypothetical protein